MRQPLNLSKEEAIALADVLLQLPIKSPEWDKLLRIAEVINDLLENDQWE